LKTPKEKDGVKYAKVARFKVVGDLKIIPGNPVGKMKYIDENITSGMSDVLLRIPKNPAVMMLDVDVNVPKDKARDGVKWITGCMRGYGLDAKAYFTGKTGYHIHYHDGIKSVDDARKFVETMVENLNRHAKIGGVEFVAGTTHPGPGKISIDWSQGSSTGKTITVPFSLRWDSCLASVPVDLDKLPAFDPDVHARPDFVLNNIDKFT
jgi:DNA primase